MAHNYTQEQREFIEKNYPGIKTPVLAQMFNERFGTDLSRQQIKSYLTNHGLHNGVVCRFEKGHVPANKGKKNATRTLCSLRQNNVQKRPRSGKS